jgi:NTE family protein
MRAHRARLAALHSRTLRPVTIAAPPPAPVPDARPLRPRGRALCLSGGGYRAALFHLGALWRLQERRWLPEVELLSSVSGGSIVSAWLASRYLADRRDEEPFVDWCRRVDFRQAVVEPFRAVVGRDIRTPAILATLHCNWIAPSARVAWLQGAYARFLGTLSLADLPESPRFVFCATDLTFGVNWEFSRLRVGDYQAGYLRQPGRIPLAAAVAASSSFPPVFGPVTFPAGPADFRRGSYRADDADRLRAAIELTDGGVYDNLGTEPALRHYREVLVSDAGAPFAFAPGRHYLRRLLRYAAVIGNQAVALRKRLLFGLLRDGVVDGAYWNLNDRGDPGSHGYSPVLIERRLARIRTDLDRFSAVEFEALVNHGYFACDNALELRQRPLSAGAPAADWPYPQRSSEAALRIALANSHRRVWPPRWWR